MPIVKTFYGLFTLKGRQAIIFIFFAYAIAFLIFLHRRNNNCTPHRKFFDFIGGKAVFLHPSAMVDYQYYFIRALFHNMLIVPIVAFIFLPEYLSGEVMASLYTEWLGPPQTTIDINLSFALLYGLCLFLLMDFSHYWVHRIFHSRFLWEFHKVHHSAEVLVPQTANRVHFIESMCETLLLFSLVGFLSGYFYYICGAELKTFQVFGVLYLTLLFNAAAANLRHSHVWLSFGPIIERIINSPAQHHIHHSNHPKHYNKNYGTNLSIWDWMFGTLYTTTSEPEDIKFGLTPKEHEKFKSLSDIIFRPFISSYQMMRRKTVKRTTISKTESK